MLCLIDNGDRRHNGEEDEQGGHGGEGEYLYERRREEEGGLWVLIFFIEKINVLFILKYEPLNSFLPHVIHLRP